MSDVDFTQDAERRRELATLPGAQRARLRPSDVGLTSGPGQRRTPGLRREEVADLAGIGLTWHTWLKRSKPGPYPPQRWSSTRSPARCDSTRISTDMSVRSPTCRCPHRSRPRGRPAAPAVAVDAVAPAPVAVYDVHYDYLGLEHAVRAGSPRPPPLGSARAARGQ